VMRPSDKGDQPSMIALASSRILQPAARLRKDSRRCARNTAQRRFSYRGHTQTYLFASECDWSISLMARLSRA